MRVSHVALDDFRSYKHAVVELQPGTTVFVGSNGQGKTNLVEAIAYLSAFTSHRVSAESALVRLPRENEDPVGGAVIRVKLIRGESSEVVPVSETIIELEIVRGKANRALLNRTQTRPRDIAGIVRTVVFAPEDLQLVRSDPAVRRAFMDDVIIQLSPVMAGIKADFDKVARHRAAVLKSAQASLRRGYAPATQMLDVWDEQFAQLSSRLTAERFKLVEKLRHPAVESYEQVADSPKHVTLDVEASISEAIHKYGSDEMSLDVSDEQTQARQMLEILRLIRDKEIERGVNLVGAHRDDLALSLGGMPVKGYASHGESWSVVLALKLAAFTVLTDGDEQPILILDDVFAELDSRRRQGLLSVIERVQQVLITAAVYEDIPQGLDGSIVYVRADEHQGTCLSLTPFGAENE